MAVPVTLPKWGMVMEEATLVSWLKDEGEQVEEGEPLLEVETEKTVGEIEAPASGTLGKILVGVDEVATVGTLLGVILEEGDGEDAIVSVIGGESAPTKSDRGQRTRISPAAKRFAEERGLNWQELSGGGPGGRIQMADVRDALEGVTSSAFDGEVTVLSPLRQAISRLTLKSIEAPQAALCREIDLTRVLEETRSGGLAPGGKKVPFTAVLVRAAAQVLSSVPILNSTFVDGKVYRSNVVNIGLVVAVEGGVIVPVIHDAGSMGILEIADQVESLSTRAREKALTEKETAGGTFTISNAGRFGIDLFQPLLTPPEVAALGIGRATSKPVVRSGNIEVGQVAFFSLSSDHRVADAEPVGLFLERLDELFQEPDRLKV